MSGRAKAKDLLMPWAALAAAAIAWSVSHQLGSNLVVDQCGVAAWWLIGLIGVLGILLAAAGAVLSRRVWQQSSESEARRFVALLGMMTAALLALAILLQTIAAFIIPRCFG